MSVCVCTALPLSSSPQSTLGPEKVPQMQMIAHQQRTHKHKQGEESNLKHRTHPRAEGIIFHQTRFTFNFYFFQFTTLQHFPSPPPLTAQNDGPLVFGPCVCVCNRKCNLNHNPFPLPSPSSLPGPITLQMLLRAIGKFDFQSYNLFHVLNCNSK